MDRQRLSIYKGGSRTVIFAIAFLLLLGAPSGRALASGQYYPQFIYMPGDIQRNSEKLWYDSPTDYYAYLFGDRLNPFSFYPAWRALNGDPLSKSDTAALKLMFNLNGDYGALRASQSDQLGVDTWLKERGEVMADGFSYPESYDSDDVACGGYFDNAVRRLRERRSTYSEADLKHWVQNQDALLNGCMHTWDRGQYKSAREMSVSEIERSAGVERGQPGLLSRIWNWISGLFGKKVAIPERKIDDSGPYHFTGGAAFLADQEYQYAASLLPGDESRSIFERLSTESSSPYQVVAKVMLLEGDLRSFEDRAYEKREQKNCGDNYDGTKSCYSYPYEVNITNSNTKVADEGRALLVRIDEASDDPSLSKYRESLLVKKERVLARLYQPEALRAAGAALSQPAVVSLPHNMAILAEQLRLVDSDEASVSFKFNPADYDEFVQFIWSWNHSQTKSARDVVASWVLKPSAIQSAWIALALRMQTLSEGENPASLFSAAAKVTTVTRLFYPVSYYLAVATRGDTQIYGDILSRVLKAGNVPDVAYNFFQDELMRRATSLAGAASHMSRKYLFYYNGDVENVFIRTSGSTFGAALANTAPLIKWYFPENRDWFLSYGRYFSNTKANSLRDDNMMQYLNYMIPLDELIAVPNIRADYLPKVFTRAFLLNRPDIYKPMLTELSDNPTLALAAVASDEVTQRFLITLALMRDWRTDSEDRFGTVIHNNNMWGDSLNDWGGYFYVYDSKTRDFVEDFPWKNDGQSSPGNYRLSDQQVSANAKEKSIVYQQSLIKPFAEASFTYASQNPSDIRIAEALHELTLFRHYHGRDDGDWPKKVFQLLHKNFPNTSWAKDTPYWY